MPFERTLSDLLAAARRGCAEAVRAEARTATRVAWVKERIAALRGLHERVDEAWERMLDSLPDDADDEALEALPQPPEQAELDALLAELGAVRDHDHWPRHLHWGDV